MSAELIGRTLGDFEIESSIGRGSFAEVYVARQRSLRRKIALKVLEVGLFTPSDNVTRFLREAEAMARMEHPHIVPVYSAGQEHPYHYFAMRLVTGGSLSQAMRNGIQRMTALRWMVQIGKALAYAHENGVVHRDLKPNNVLLQDDDAVLVDFGLARLKDLSTITQSGAVLGTPLYMSPEQTLGKEAGASSDVFSLGVMAYELLLGKHPFSSQVRPGLTRIEARSQLFDRIRGAIFIAPRTVDPTLPACIDSILFKALQADPAMRYQNASEMLPDLLDAYRSAPNSEHLIRADGADRASSCSASDSTQSSAPPPSSSGIGLELGHKPTQQQFGRYHIKREIGHGGQGVVYEAYDPIVDRQVALKVLQASLENAEQMRALMEHEARVTGRLAHPHIIRVYDFGIQEGQPYLTMQFVEGPSLDGMLAAKTPLPLFFALNVLHQSAEALAFAHKSGVIHLDVKPGNILIGQTAQTLSPRNSASLGKFHFPHVYLSDFTMAAIRRDIKQTIRLPSPIGSAHLRPSVMKGVTAGTIPYAAPEQLDGGETKRIGPPSDLFALGVVFHEMLTGQRLFAAQHLSVTQMLVQRGQVPPPSTLTQGIPPEVDALCLHMLARNVDDRIASAEEVVHATAEILEKLEA